MTHTPGPWEFGGNFGPKDDVEIWANADLVAMVSNQTELDTLLANARLIAAAPALLKALEALSDRFAFDGVPEDGENEYEMACNAIALAKGEEVTT